MLLCNYYKITIFLWKLEAFISDIKRQINKTNRKQLARQTDPYGEDLYSILAIFVWYKQF
jgi:hypothetical protein